MFRHFSQLFSIGFSIILGTFGTGCSGFIYGTTGDIISDYAVEHMGPYVLGSSDIQMACEDGRSIGNLLMSFERVTDAPNKAAVTAMVSAAMCAEFDAYEYELQHMLHLKAARVAEATDSRILQKRAHELAARRNARAYQRLAAAFGTPGEGCPEFDEGEEILYLMGLSAGLQAALHDKASGGMVGVDMGIPAQVIRATECLDTNVYWGLPGAIRGAIYASIPATAPQGFDPWQLLEESAAIGDAGGVRMARALYIRVASSAGKSEKNPELIGQAVVSQAAVSAPANGGLLDAYATVMVRHFSDLIWMDGKGHRTPAGMLGSFWEEDAEEDGDSDDLLDGLE